MKLFKKLEMYKFTNAYITDFEQFLCTTIWRGHEKEKHKL